MNQAKSCNAFYGKKISVFAANAQFIFFCSFSLGVCEKCGVKCVCCITNILHPFPEIAAATADDDDEHCVPEHVYITFKLKPNK